MGEVVRLIDRQGEMVGEMDPLVMELNKKIAALAAENTRLRREKDEAEGRLPDSQTVLDVLKYHHRLFPRSRIVKGKSPAKTAVRDMLGKVDELSGNPLFTPLHLKAAAMGLKFNRVGEKACRPSGAAWLYSDEDRVQFFIDQASSFKRDTGTSALAIVDELGRPGLEKLAARCSCCGHLRLDHERERPELDLFDPPCAVHGCACPGFDDFDWKVEVHMARLERERIDAA